MESYIGFITQYLEKRLNGHKYNKKEVTAVMNIIKKLQTISTKKT